VWADPNNLGGSATLPPNGLLQRLWGPQPSTFEFVRPLPGVSTTTLAHTILAAHLDPDLHVYTPIEYSSELAREVSQYLKPFWALQRMMLLVAFIATLSTLLLVGVQRRREQGLLGAVGMGPTRLARMVLVEGGAIGVCGSVLGILASLGLAGVLIQVSGVLFGLRPPLRIDLRPGLLYAVVGTLIVLAAAAWPAWRTSRLQVVEALRYE
jgi:putative ABC transport system permease protein